MSFLTDFVARGFHIKNGIPTEYNGDVIYVVGAGLMEWTVVTGTGAFTGYRCLEVGRPEFGSTTIPRTYELEMLGGLTSKAAYASLWAWAQQQGHVVSSASWATKVFKFADVDANYFRLPDLRNMFIRFSGTSADSGTTRDIGTYEAFANASHTHTGSASAAGNHYHNGTTDAGGYHNHSMTLGSRDSTGAKPADSGGGNTYTGYVDAGGSHSHTFSTGWSVQGDHTHTITINATGNSEARPVNTAFAPRVHI